MTGLIHFFRHLFDTTGYVRRGECGGWTADLSWLQNVSDLLIWAAYIAIPLVLLFYARHQKKLPFRHLFWLFGLFIAACGTTHFMSYITTLYPAYRLEGVIKLITAIASWGTVVAIAAITPRALNMRMPEELEQEIREKGEIQRELALLNDSLVTRTKQLENANRELEGFNNMVAHDLRSPLRTIVTASQIALEDAPSDLDPETKYRLGRLCASAQRMASLVEDLLEFSRLGREEIHPTPVDLTALSLAVARDIQEEYALASFQIEPGMTVEGDPRLLRVALYNLMQNASKYARDGLQPVIEVGRIETSNGPAIRVADNGIGFDMAYIDRIFQPFERLHNDDIPGTGIGLANVQRVIERHGGRLWALSRLGVGSEFFFTLQATDRSPANT